MKSLKTIISIVFIVGTIALIIYDSNTKKQATPSLKSLTHQDSVAKDLRK